MLEDLKNEMSAFFKDIDDNIKNQDDLIYVKTRTAKLVDFIADEIEKIIDYKEEKSIIEIKNKLSIGDTIELIIPNRLEPEVFKITKLWDYETEEEIDSISPGVKGQKVYMKLPIECEKDWIIRRKKA